MSAEYEKGLIQHLDEHEELLSKRVIDLLSSSSGDNQDNNDFIKHLDNFLQELSNASLEITDIDRRTRLINTATKWQKALSALSIPRSIKIHDPKKPLQPPPASRDPMTGLLNFGAFDEQLLLAVEDAKKDKQPLLLVIFDIDDFRKIDSIVDKDVATEILTQVASLLGPRSPDLLFRYPQNYIPTNKEFFYPYSGDEFVIISYNTTIKGGVHPGTNKRVNHGGIMVERLQENVWKAEFPKLIEKRKEGHLVRRLTVSAGISETIPSLDPEDTADKLKYRAELALNKAKLLNKKNPNVDQSFRGRIIAWDPIIASVVGGAFPPGDEEIERRDSSSGGESGTLL